MARAFTEDEREIIRERLVDRGRTAFSTFGLRKTSVDELIKGVGISKGSFYAFFASKEDLYLEVIEAEESGFRNTLFDLLGDGKLTERSLKTFLLEGLRLMETNPLMRRMRERDELGYFLRAVSPDQLSKHLQSDEHWMSELIADWQEQGVIVSGDPHIIAGAITLILTTSLYKDSLGGENYPESINFLIDLVASGLTKKAQAEECK